MHGIQLARLFRDVCSISRFWDRYNDLVSFEFRYHGNERKKGREVENSFPFHSVSSSFALEKTNRAENNNVRGQKYESKFKRERERKRYTQSPSKRIETRSLLLNETPSITHIHGESKGAIYGHVRGRVEKLRETITLIKSAGRTRGSSRRRRSRCRRTSCRGRSGCCSSTRRARKAPG